MSDTQPKPDDHEVVIEIWGYHGFNNWSMLDITPTDLDEALKAAEEQLESDVWRWMNVQVKTTDTYVVERKDG